MGLFSIFKRKQKHLSVVEYDKLVESKVAKIREFVRLNIHVERDDKNFDEEFGKAFELYKFNLRQELTKIPNKWGSFFIRKNVVLSPVSALHTFNKTYRRKTKVVWYKRFLRFFKSIKVYVVLFIKDLLLRRELRKIKKLFPDYKLSNKMASGILNAVDLNKRVMEKFPEKKR
jgi:hypothetical protein